MDCLSAKAATSGSPVVRTEKYDIWSNKATKKRNVKKTGEISISDW